MNGSDSAPSLLGKKFTTTKSDWLADAADLFVLLCSFLLTTARASIALIALMCANANLEWDSLPWETLSIPKRGISALSITITSGGKRYVLFNLARGGVRSRNVAVYSNPSIGNLARYSARHGFEPPGLWAWQPG